MNKLETLQSALKGRNEEIMGYQINIDNYIRATAKINSEHVSNPAMIEFRDRLADMLESHKVEQLKAIIIRDVIADQIAELEAAECFMPSLQRITRLFGIRTPFQTLGWTHLVLVFPLKLMMLPLHLLG